MVYKNKVYVAFDGDSDINYYDLMRAWNNNDNFDFEINDAHDINRANDSSKEESIKKQLRERFLNSKLFILLIGEHTKYLTKFVKWEIETAIKLKLPIIAINLNGARSSDHLMPATLNNELSIFIPFKEKIIKYAMENWPDQDKQYREKGKFGNYHYNETVYERLRID